MDKTWLNVQELYETNLKLKKSHYEMKRLLVLLLERRKNTNFLRKSLKKNVAPEKGQTKSLLGLPGIHLNGAEEGNVEETK